ncbi:MAG: hypothetical protein IPO67_27390 [Deltaproteobacteria bacterium]|jgi:hypothetical protein|nr:hypothetical protein [Deltaproteobacteria bacterium]MBK9648830.1 hypothetical protein [Deltaproteobacteria bacterium]
MSKAETIARELANAHREADPLTSHILYFPTAQQGEVRLLEVSSELPPLGEAVPYRYRAAPEHGVPFPVVLILLAEADWAQVQSRALPLPEGWDLTTAEAI